MPEDLLNVIPPAADLRVSYGPGACHFGDLRFGTGELRDVVVMNIHGGFWRNRYNLRHAGHFCAALTRRGFTTWNIEYSRVGDEGGGWPGTLEDIRRAWAYIPKLAASHGLRAEHVLVTGHSAGGQLALCLAAYERVVRCVVSLAGVIDLQRAWELHLSSDAVAEFLGGSPDEVPERYQAADPMQLPIQGCKQWILHGREDCDVPPEFSRRCWGRKQSRGEDAHLLQIRSADHFDLIDPRSAAWTMVEDRFVETANAFTTKDKKVPKGTQD
ncbi:MAG TPA: alpha/beta hydrolase [Terriglobales bacterium]|nr:alpha/beta hydrolase [Terriglobales bacterium]